jgi:hypothetical protein
MYQREYFPISPFNALLIPIETARPQSQISEEKKKTPGQLRSVSMSFTEL